MLSEEEGYIGDESTLDKAIQSINTLPLQIQHLKTSQAKMELVYKDGCNLMSLCFHDAKHGKLPIIAIETFIDIALQLVRSTDLLLINFIELMPDNYKIEHHSVNVCILSIFLGHKLSLHYSILQKLAMAALLHDVGKVKIKREILQKDGKLEPQELKVIQELPAISADIASRNGINDKYILEAILSHHEKLDGSGHPRGLTEEKIPKIAQIIAICDVFDALTTDRVFRKKYKSFDALKLMSTQMKNELNQTYIKHFIQLLHK